MEKQRQMVMQMAMADDAMVQMGRCEMVMQMVMVMLMVMQMLRW